MIATIRGVNEMTIPVCADCGNFIGGKVFTTLSPDSTAKLCQSCHNVEVEMTLDE